MILLTYCAVRAELSVGGSGGGCARRGAVRSRRCALARPPRGRPLAHAVGLVGAVMAPLRGDGGRCCCCCCCLWGVAVLRIAAVWGVCPLLPGHGTHSSTTSCTCTSGGSGGSRHWSHTPGSSRYGSRATGLRWEPCPRAAGAVHNRSRHDGQRIEGLGTLTNLRCLFLHNNLISVMEGVCGEARLCDPDVSLRGTQGWTCSLTFQR